MAEFRAATGRQPEFLARLLERGHLIATGVPGVYGRGPDFERVRTAFSALVGRTAAPEHPEQMRFPPLLPRRRFEQTEYLSSFPHLAGAVFAFEGGESEAREQYERASRHEDWSGHQQMSELVLVPAACYPVYPAVAERGPLAPGGLLVDAGDAYVFRHEPSDDPARMQMFHQRELVRLGEPETVIAWRDHWRDRALELLGGLGLDADAGAAADPFFGRTGRVLAAGQRSQELKFEVEVPLAGDEPTAVASFNYHRSYFADTYGIEMAGGGEAHTACLGFGEERVTLALFWRHGLEIEDWPAAVTETLGEAR